MLIGIVSPYDLSRPGGVQEAALSHAAYLRKRGHQVQLIAPFTKSRQLNSAVLTLGHARNVHNPLGTSGELSYISRRQAEQLLTKNKFDILHFHEPWVPLLAPKLLKLAKKKGIKTVATFHAKLPKGWFAKLSRYALKLSYGRRVLKRLDRVVAVSEPAAELLRFINPHTAVEIIPNAIDETKYHITTKRTAHPLTETDKFVIVYIGRLEERKGLSQLIQAVQLVAKRQTSRQVRLVIAGEGGIKEKLKLLATGLDIYFLGYIEEATKLTLLQSVDVGCFPALYGESFGIVLIEAMAMGLPIIAGDNEGYKNILVGEGKIGLVDCSDPSALARKIEQFMDEKLLKKLKTWGLNEVKQYTYSAVVEVYEKMYFAIAKD